MQHSLPLINWPSTFYSIHHMNEVHWKLLSETWEVHKVLYHEQTTVAIFVASLVLISGFFYAQSPWVPLFGSPLSPSTNAVFFSLRLADISESCTLQTDTWVQMKGWYHVDGISFIHEFLHTKTFQQSFQATGICSSCYRMLSSSCKEISGLGASIGETKWVEGEKGLKEGFS